MRGKKKSTWWTGCLISFLMLAPVVFAAGATFIVCDHAETAEGRSFGETAHGDGSYAKGQTRAPTSMVARIAEFAHVFATCLYAVAAPLALVTLIVYHWRHRRRMPRICMCLLVATLGALMILAGWQFAFWWLCGLGVILVVSGHAVSIVLEYLRNLLRAMR
jgi:uncharacterized membrane protein YhaH (DUF805 family)